MFYALSKAVVRAIGKLVWRVRAYGEQNVPAKGAFIVACNHVSFLDPPILGAFCPRTIRYMAKKELFRIPVLGFIIRALGAYPVDREGSAKSAIQRSIDVLRRGEVVGIFPEGARNRQGLVPARRGVALLAAHANVCVLPAAVVGSDRARSFAPIKVLFGQPLHFESTRHGKEPLEEFTTTVMAEIRALAELGSRA